MRTAPPLFLFIILLPFVGAHPAFASQHDALPVIIYDRPPLYDLSTSPPSGLIIDPTAAVLEAAGIDYRWRISSAKAALMEIQRNKMPLCATGWYRLPARERYAKYTRPFYQDGARVAIVRRDDARTRQHRNYFTLLRDRALTIGIKSAYSYGEYVDRMITDLKPRSVITSQNGPGMLRMLLGGRFDYFLLNGEQARYLVEASPEREVLMVKELDDAPPGSYRHILCTEKTDAAIIERLNQAIERLALPPSPGANGTRQTGTTAHAQTNSPPETP